MPETAYKELTWDTSENPPATNCQTANRQITWDEANEINNTLLVGI